jgi:HAD superfamily hydrolase (TIGR01484 family)
VCDRTWELQRKHSIYYDYTVVQDDHDNKDNENGENDTMETFLQRLERGDGKHKRGGIIKLMALDRNRTAPEVFESLPDTLRPSSSSTTTTGTSEASAEEVTTSPSPQVSLTYSGNYFLEISAAGVNKGLGLAKYCEALQIPRENVVAFGDLLNDAEMLQFAGLGLCMGNGHESMKKLADRVIGTNAEDGLAKEIESWFA